MGAALHSAHAHGAHLFPGAGLRRADLFCRAWRRWRPIAGAALDLAGVLASEVLGQVQKPEAEISDELGIIALSIVRKVDAGSRSLRIGYASRRTELSEPPTATLLVSCPASYRTSR